MHGVVMLPIAMKFFLAHAGRDYSRGTVDLTMQRKGRRALIWIQLSFRIAMH